MMKSLGRIFIYLFSKSEKSNLEESFGLLFLMKENISENTSSGCMFQPERVECM